MQFNNLSKIAPIYLSLHSCIIIVQWHDQITWYDEVVYIKLAVIALYIAYFLTVLINYRCWDQ